MSSTPKPNDTNSVLRFCNAPWLLALADYLRQHPEIWRDDRQIIILRNLTTLRVDILLGSSTTRTYSQTWNVFHRSLCKYFLKSGVTEGGLLYSCRSGVFTKGNLEDILNNIRIVPRHQQKRKAEENYSGSCTIA